MHTRIQWSSSAFNAEHANHRLIVFMDQSVQEGLQVLIDRVDNTQPLVDELQSSLDFYRKESKRLREELDLCRLMLVENEKLSNRSVALVVNKIVKQV